MTTNPLLSKKVTDLTARFKSYGEIYRNTTSELPAPEPIVDPNEPVPTNRGASTKLGREAKFGKGGLSPEARKAISDKQKANAANK